MILMGLRCGRMVMVRVGIGGDPALWGDGLGEWLLPPTIWRDDCSADISSRLGQSPIYSHSCSTFDHFHQLRKTMKGS